MIEREGWGRQLPALWALPFALATLVPVALIAAGALAGGVWVWLSALVPTLGVGVLDLLARRARAAGPSLAEGVEFPAGTGLSVALGLLHFPVLALGIAAVAGLTGLGLAERAGMALGVGVWLGQVSAANAHELIHRPKPGLYALGRWVYATLLFGHHVSAHRLVHHSHVATPQDPNSARRGEGVYRFLWRAWRGSWRAGLAAERRRIAARMGRAEAEVPFWATPHAGYVAVALGVLGLAALAGVVAGGLADGLRAVGAAALLGLYASAQVLVSDYVQHYGLRRRRLADGQFEPCGAAHSWNAPHPVSSQMMLHAPRHSDHHQNPARPWPALRLPPGDAAPQLPASLPAMGMLALVPPLWRKVMDPRLPDAAAAPNRGGG